MKKQRRRKKLAAIIAPAFGKEGSWLCITVDGNLDWKSCFECDSLEDAKEWKRGIREHWRKLKDIEVCHRLASSNVEAMDAANDSH